MKFLFSSRIIPQRDGVNLDGWRKWENHLTCQKHMKKRSVCFEKKVFKPDCVFVMRRCQTWRLFCTAKIFLNLPPPHQEPEWVCSLPEREHSHTLIYLNMSFPSLQTRSTLSASPCMQSDRAPQCKKQISSGLFPEIKKWRHLFCSVEPTEAPTERWIHVSENGNRSSTDLSRLMGICIRKRGNKSSESQSEARHAPLSRMNKSVCSHLQKKSSRHSEGYLGF